jgi:hypothetical protein
MSEAAEGEPQDINWTFWVALALWPLIPASKLVCGIDPEESTPEDDFANIAIPKSRARLPWVNVYHQAVSAIKARELNAIDGEVKPAEFIAWTRKGVQIPAQLLAMLGGHALANQNTPTPGGENENVGRRSHNKRETEARHHEWQERIDNLAQHFPGKSHAEYCRKLSKQIGVPFATIRRNTKLGHS